MQPQQFHLCAHKLFSNCDDSKASTCNSGSGFLCIFFSFVFVVFYDGSPYLATVLKSMDELTAITKYDGQFCETIKVISMKTYLEKKAKLIRKMKEEMEIAKLEETLRKHFIGQMVSARRCQTVLSAGTVPVH